jgi:DNA helicase II / ATP-dependent DNA helicase PcrA
VSLNPAQRAAVEHRGGPLLVLAGAGTGKTRVITHRVAALLDEGIPPWRILAVTFTNRAAGEMRERIDRLCAGRHPVGELWVGTFHSICARILRRHGEPLGLSPRFAIYDTADQVAVMRRVLDDMKVADSLYTPRGILGHIDRAKNRGLGPDQLDPLGIVEPVRTVVARAYAAYQARLRASDAVDFGDLLLHVVTLLRDAGRPSDRQLGDLDPMVRFATRFLHIVVDEFQDTNPVQAELVDRLAGGAELCVVGDDDQSIYGWRGADVAQILRFGDLHPGTRIVRLEQNYRSTMNILRCAGAVIRRNSGRLGKTLWSENGEGDPVRILMLEDERQEARLIAHEARRAIDDGEDPEEIAVFYRTHALSRVIEDEVRRVGLSCRIVGGVAFYERAEVKDLLSYLFVLRNPASDVHLLRILNRPTRGIGATSRDRMTAHAAERGTSLWDVLRDPAAAGLKAGACRKVRAFATLLEDLRERLDSTPLVELVPRVADATGYREMLALDDDDEARARLENLQELQGNVLEFAAERPEATLDDFLEVVSLVGSERAEGDARRAISLMTVHSAKGLEFQRVYLIGCEERVFPHARVLDDPVQMEEERRLAYVALTRAKQTLTLTMAATRRLFGQTQVGTASRFVDDLPHDSIEQLGRRSQRRSSVAARGAAAAPVVTRARQQDWRDDIEYDGDPDIPFDDDDGSHTEVDGGVSLYVGMSVRHRVFGEGEVLGWSGSGSKLKLTVRLGNREVKTIMARFLEPA